MAGDPFGLLLRQRIVFLGGEVSFQLHTPDQDTVSKQACLELLERRKHGTALPLQVNDFSADAIISQLLLLDSQSPNKVAC
jgi:ATP-dependent protease ClpP protease subunit